MQHDNPMILISQIGIMEETYQLYTSCLEYVEESIAQKETKTPKNHFAEIARNNKNGVRRIDIDSLLSINESSSGYINTKIREFFDKYYAYFFESNYLRTYPSSITKRQLRYCPMVVMVNANAVAVYVDGTNNVFGNKYRYCSFEEFIDTLISIFIDAKLYYNSLQREKGNTRKLTQMDYSDAIKEMKDRLSFYSGHFVADYDTEIHDTEIIDASNQVGETVWIYEALNQTTCNKNHHYITPAKYRVKSNKGDVLLPIHKCQECKKLFIGRITLELYTRAYGRLNITTHKDIADQPEYSIFPAESKLHSLGYNVVEGKMTEKERRALLKSLIDSKAISVFEASRDIEAAIKRFLNNSMFSLAVEKWQSDLKYLGDIVADSQDIEQIY